MGCEESMDDYEDVSHDSDSDDGVSPPSGLPSGFGAGLTTGELASRALKTSDDPVLYTPFDRNADPARVPIQVDPGVIDFDSITPGVLYVMTFSVRNSSSQGQRIRIKAPSSMYFALNYTPTGVIAPGIELRAEIECQYPEGSKEGRYTDKIVITMGEHKLEVPLIATRQYAKVKFNKFVDLGYASENQVVTSNVEFYNSDYELDGNMTLVPSEDSRITIHPTKFSLKPRQSASVEISYEAQDLGPWREMVEVLTEGAHESDYMDCSVQTVDQKIALLADKNGGIMDAAGFGSLFYGQEKEMKGFLVNTGPQQLSFSISYQDEEGEGPKDPEAAKQLAETINVTPKQGIIKPFSQVEMCLKFTPLMPPPAKGFLHEYNAESREKKVFQRRAFIDCLEMNQRLNLNMEGDAQSADVSLSPAMLRFGSCPVYDRRDILVNLVNKSEMRTPFNFQNIAHFKITPGEGVLGPFERISIIASFTPTQLGVFKKVCTVSYCDGLSSDEIKVVAEAERQIHKEIVGGPEALPEHFERVRKFVDPEEVALSRESKRKGDKKASVESRHENALTALIEASVDPRDALYESEESSRTSLVSMHPLKLKRENEKIYNNYLTKSYDRRKDHKMQMKRETMMAYRGVDPSDPTSYDFTLEHDLDEPELHIPKGGERLWLADSADNKRQRPVLDENRLIMKKFSPTPATQAEMRDCTMELDPNNMALVSASHKIMNFGRVCVGSSTTKSFSVTNELAGSCMVKLEELEPEVRQSKPEAQVIPPGAVAGFDINFTSKTLGEYRKTFCWNLNGNHLFRVVVVAEVVPIEVELSKTELNFEFPGSSTDSSLANDIMLKNTGNATADFLWGSSGAFECKPDKGSINPGQTAIISVVWTPAAGRRNEEELGLHIPGGVDQTLVVSGTVHSTKMVFDKPKLSFGTVAVGTEKEMTVKLKNQGQHTGVYLVEGLDERQGIRINPDRALVLPGESAEISVVVAPKAAMSYDNAQVSLNIRGQKPVVLKFSGESIIPQIEVAEQSIEMPTVPIGSEFRAPLALTNESDIVACLIIDLKKYGDFMPTIHDMESADQDSTKQFDAHHNCIELLDDKSNSSASGMPANTWKVTLQPKSTLEGFLLFMPTVAKKYNFKIPIDIQGIEGNRALHCDLAASSSPSRLGLSTSIVDLGDCVVSRDPMNRSSYFSEVVFKNLDASQGFSYEIKERQAPNSAEAALQGEAPTFFVSPTRGDLAPGTTNPIRLTFQPQARGKYTKILDIYITGQPSADVPYFSILCRGSGVYPSLSFSQRDVMMPTVPLDITSRGSFEIINQGYSSLQVDYKLSPPIMGKLELEFPDGKELGVTKSKIRVNVTSKSHSPVSWSGIIEFMDKSGEKFGMTISGCSDNCVLTNNSYIRNYSKLFGFIGLENQPPLYMLKSQMQLMRAEEAKRKEEIRKARQAARQAGGGSVTSSKDQDGESKSSKKSKKDEMMMVQDLAAEDDIVEADPESAFDDREARFCLKWLNRNVMDQPVDEERFPHCIIETNGNVMVDCVEALCGRKLQEVRKVDQEEARPASGAPGSAASSRKSDKGDGEEKREKVDPAHAKAAKMLKKYQALLTVLTSYGALVTHINAMNLLSIEDHIQAQITHAKVMEGSRLTPNMLTDLKEVWKSQWLLNCKGAWMDVIYQSIKVFVLSRVSYDELIKLPGFPAPTNAGKEDPAAVKQGGKDAKKKPKRVKAPPEFGRSNIYTQSESALLAWLSHHVNQAGELKDEGAHGSKEQIFGVKKRLVDFESDLADLLGYCQLFHSHVPETAQVGGCLVGYTAIDRNMDREALFSKFVGALTDFRLSFALEEPELTGSRRSVILMILHLYLNLPNLMPKGKIEFQGVLGNPVQKTIELRNPSRKPVKYDVTIQGSDDFILSSEVVEIAPNSHSDYLITLKARFFEPTSAKVTFWGVRQQGLAGRSIVFQLTSKMTSRAPVASTTINVGLFEMKPVEIVITNPFPKDVNLPVQLMYHHAAMSVDDVIAVQAGKRGFPAKGTPIDRSDEEVGADEDYEIIQNFRMPIWCNEESIQLGTEDDEPRRLTLNVLPFIMGTYTCHIVLVDKRFGEFCHELVVECGFPRPVENLQFDAVCQEISVKTLSVSAKNQAFEKALTMIIDTRMGNSQKKQRARQLLSGMLASPVDDEATMVSTFNLHLRNEAFKTPKTVPFLSEYIPFNPASTAQKPATAKKISKTELDGEAAPRSGPNVAAINFCPDKPGQYDSDIVVFSKFNRYDVRLFALKSGVKMPNKKLVIEFNGPTLHKLEQEIPILNETQDDWHLTATVSGRGFAGPKTLHVGKKSRAVYVLNFTAPAMGMFEGQLSLKGTEGQDHFEYTLIGNAGKALATEHLVYQCKARHNTKFKIYLSRNNKERPKKDPEPGGRTVSYSVNTDLQYIFGSDVAEVPVSGGDYEFSVMCPVSGVMSGSISFTDKEGFTIWYTLDVEVTAPMAESTIVIESQVRKACSVEIGLENPLSEDLMFDVKIDGEGVFGDSFYSLPSKDIAGNVASYELIYSPLMAGRTGGRISFTNEKVGEIWYELDLSALDADPVEIPPVETMLGATDSVEVPIENPLSEEIVLLAEISGSDNFFVKQDSVTLDPFMQTTFDVFFRPSALSELSTAEVTLTGDKFGSITFLVSGSGLLPGVMPEVEIVSPLNEFRSHVVSFRNPFSVPLPIDITLDEEAKDSPNADPVFKLLMKQSEGIVVAPKALCQLSLSFSPNHLGEYLTVMQVRAGSGPGGGMRNYTWAYPVKGLVEAGTPQYLDVIRTACKTTLIREIEIYLRGMPPSSDDKISLDDFVLEVVNEKATGRQQLQRVFRVDLMSIRVLTEEEKQLNEASYSVVCRVLFEPLRTISTEVALVLDCRGVGRWRAQMDIESTDPLPDDSIHLVAPVTGSDVVKFRLSNRFLGISNFAARFAPGSSPHFRVTPTAGALAPFGSNGTEFSILFSPVTYGIREVANLVIETDDAQWNYEVTGSYPDVSIDKSLIESKIDNKR